MNKKINWPKGEKHWVTVWKWRHRRGQQLFFLIVVLTSKTKTRQRRQWCAIIWWKGKRSKITPKYKVVKVARSWKIAVGVVHVFHWSARKWCDRGGRTSFAVARALQYRVTMSSRVCVTVLAVSGRRYARSARVQWKLFGGTVFPSMSRGYACNAGRRVSRVVPMWRHGCEQFTSLSFATDFQFRNRFRLLRLLAVNARLPAFQPFA